MATIKDKTIQGLIKLYKNKDLDILEYRTGIGRHVLKMIIDGKTKNPQRRTILKLQSYINRMTHVRTERLSK